jgi:hypothetical protein
MLKLGPRGYQDALRYTLRFTKTSVACVSQNSFRSSQRVRGRILRPLLPLQAQTQSAQAVAISSLLNSALKRYQEITKTDTNPAINGATSESSE